MNAESIVLVMDSNRGNLEFLSQWNTVLVAYWLNRLTLKIYWNIYARRLVTKI
jgi:hypothetical protein